MSDRFGHAERDVSPNLQLADGRYRVGRFENAHRQPLRRPDVSTGRYVETRFVVTVAKGRQVGVVVVEHDRFFVGHRGANSLHVVVASGQYLKSGRFLSAHPRADDHVFDVERERKTHREAHRRPNERFAQESFSPQSVVRRHQVFNGIVLSGYATAVQPDADVENRIADVDQL